LQKLREQQEADSEAPLPEEEPGELQRNLKAGDRVRLVSGVENCGCLDSPADVGVLDDAPDAAVWPFRVRNEITNESHWIPQDLLVRVDETSAPSTQSVHINFYERPLNPNRMHRYSSVAENQRLLRLKPVYARKEGSRKTSRSTIEDVWRARLNNKAWQRYFRQRLILAEKDSAFQPKVVAYIPELSGTLICRQVSAPAIVGPGFQGYFPERRFLPTTVFSFIWLVACAFLVVVYGLKFDLHRSDSDKIPSYMSSWSPGSAWLFMNLLAFIQSVILFQPVSMILRSLLKALGSRGLFTVAVTALNNVFFCCRGCSPHAMGVGITFSFISSSNF
jgi:hypothetical protein